MVETPSVNKQFGPVIQVTSSLNPGGAERVALNLANALAQGGANSHLCVTREGPGLLSEVGPGVKLLTLGRASRVDIGAILRFARYIREHRIRIIHSHSTSLFIAAIVNRLCPETRLVWHDHYGAFATVDRPVWLYRLFTRRVGGVIAVNTPLFDWAKTRLRIPLDRLWYVPNFVIDEVDTVEVPDLPGKAGYRVVCVANLRPQKDHPNLLSAMQSVLGTIPQAHLLLVGVSNEDAYFRSIMAAATQGPLSERVTWMGARGDVRAILRGCDVGVLSSASEGLPLALLEYGMAGLASVSTAVGECPAVLAKGEAGILVPPGDPGALAEAITTLLRDPRGRRAVGLRLRDQVREHYGQERAISQIERIYGALDGPQ